MRSFVAAFIVAAIVGGLLTPAVRRFALYLGAVSHPGGRNINQQAIPRLGGLAIMAAFFAPLVGLFFVESVVADVFRHDLRRVVGLFLGGALMCAVGFVDDARGVRAVHKLLAQIAVGALAYGCGYQIAEVQLPLLGHFSIGVFALPVTILWIVGIINAVNLIDGLDGLAAGVVFFAALTNFVVAHVAGATLAALLMAAMMGAVVGFLFYNFNPARIFMGDSGSYFLGFVLAATSLAGTPKASTPVALLVPVLAMGVPIFDVLLTMARRVLERRSIFSPDRGHIHHRLLDMGITHRRAVLIIYGVCGVLAAAAIAVYIGRAWQVGVALLLASVAFAVLVRLAGYFEHFEARRRQKGQPKTQDVERLRRALPALPLALDGASTTNDVLHAFDAFCSRAGLSRARICDRTDGKVLHEFAPPLTSELQGDVVARFSVGGVDQRSIEVHFAWSSEYGEVSPQSEVLLQVAVDQVETHLSRIRSSLVLIDPFAAGREQPDVDDASLPGPVG